MPVSPSIDAEGVVRVTVRSDGVALAETIQVISVLVSRRVNAIPSAQLVVLDGDMPGQTFPVSEKDLFKPGAAISISAGYGETETSIFEGIVVRHGIKITGDPKRDPAMLTLGAQAAWLIFRIAYLVFMSVAGSLIANKGIQLYFSSLQVKGATQIG